MGQRKALEVQVHVVLGGTVGLGARLHEGGLEPVGFWGGRGGGVDVCVLGWGGWEGCVVAWFFGGREGWMCVF